MTIDASRFTDRARKVMQLANQEAQRFNHEYIGTEHLLVALARVEDGVAGAVLIRLGATFEKIRLETERIVSSGPAMVTIGKLPQTPRTRQVLTYAVEEAGKLGHNYIGTEHILLGLLRESEGTAALVLKKLNLSFDVIRREVLAVLGFGMEEKSPADNQADEPKRYGLLDMQLDDSGRRLVATYPMDISQEEIELLVKNIQWTQLRP